MLTQYQLTLCPEQPCRPQPEWAYRLYAALLAQTPGDFASRAHRDGVTPVSQYLTGRQPAGGGERAGAGTGAGAP